MRNICFLLIVLILTGCAGKEIVKEPVKKISEDKAVEIVKQETETAPPTGWTDKDTYTVSVTAPDNDKAREAAKHKILHDIVKVRMMNESRFTDITKISAEFDKPLKEGKVISQKQVSGGLQIYFQIRDNGLKEKFERK
jgi:PBP1b-binding outer membrane lipoprotein LpoB